ncbi:hydratase [Anopheles sinensis]|uniref:Hydratase n=1 Tax=Anopheles sinensis TaxID=74873 RepID=A0A084WSK5_ANOSI|nr:hydratase [Anopheles sinensis]
MAKVKVVLHSAFSSRPATAYIVGGPLRTSEPELGEQQCERIGKANQVHQIETTYINGSRSTMASLKPRKVFRNLSKQNRSAKDLMCDAGGC